MKLLLILFNLLLCDEAYSDYVVVQSPNPSPWENSAPICSAPGRNVTFAVPDVNLLKMTVKDKISLTEEAWVGYFQSYEYFRVLVCVPLNVIESLVPAQFSITGNTNRPGLCYSICGLQGIIGLQANSCFCITTRNFSIPDVQIINSSCKDPVLCENGMLCGYKGNNTIAVYEKVSTSTSIIGSHGIGCIIVENDGTYKMSVVNCSNNYEHLCESSTAYIRHLNVSSKRDQWVYTVTDCTETGQRPTSYVGDGTQFEFPNIFGSWWISVVRDLVIRNRSESGSKKETPLSEGFLKNIRGEIKLEFVSARENLKRKYVVCMSDKMENVTSDQKTTRRIMTSSDPPKPKDPTQTTGKTNNGRTNEPGTTSLSSSTSEATTKTNMGGQTRNDKCNQTNKQATTTLTSSTSETSTTTQTPGITQTTQTPGITQTTQIPGITQTTQTPGQPVSKQGNGTHTSAMTTTTSSTSKAPTMALIPGIIF